MQELHACMDDHLGLSVLLSAVEIHLLPCQMGVLDSDGYSTASEAAGQ